MTKSSSSQGNLAPQPSSGTKPAPLIPGSAGNLSGRPNRDQVASAIHASLLAWDTESFQRSDWPDRATEDVMRKLVKAGALPKECSPEYVEP